jgi:hypothetical protein
MSPAERAELKWRYLSFTRRFREDCARAATMRQEAGRKWLPDSER